MKILHAFADSGAEDPTLSRYGDVVRLTINAETNKYSDVIQADATEPPFVDNVSFDLGIGHPPCGGVSPMSDTGEGSRNDWPDLVPECRELFERHCDHYIIENKPRDSLNDPVILDGHMFELGIEYKRAFETSYHVAQPRQQTRLRDPPEKLQEHHAKGHWKGSKELWKSAKGYSHDWPSRPLKRSAIPRAYLNYLIRPLL